MRGEISGDLNTGLVELENMNSNGYEELSKDARRDLITLSPVAQLFSGQSVLITGASGFIGRVLLEKLLRTYQDIKCVYLLLRPKKQIQPEERLHKHLLNAPIFDTIRSMKNGEQLFDKIVIISGDIKEENMGISEEDREKLVKDSSLSIVFHSAASVKFDEPLQASVRINLRATKYIIDLCKQMKNLKSLCHVSTAYVNSDLTDGREIEEKLYPIDLDPEKMMKLVELLDESMLRCLTEKLVARRPNTYTLTKALTEHMIALEAANLPVAIVRPSIVVAAWKEPFPGWVDNMNGPTGLILAIGKGLLRTLHVNRPCKADMIPVDIVVNTMIASAHYVATELTHSTALKKLENGNFKLATKCEPLPGKQIADTLPGPNHKQTLTKNSRIAEQQVKQPPIFHCTSGDVRPITWGEMEGLFLPIILKYPSEQLFRYPNGTFKANKYFDLFIRFFVHFLPALMFDLVCLVSGRKRQLMYIYKRLHSSIEVLNNFCTVNYNFNSKNLRMLQESLTDPLDKRQLYLDISDLDWVSFWDDYVLGARRFVLKESDQTLAKSRDSCKRSYYLEMAFRAILMLICLNFVYRFVGHPMKQLVANLY